MPRYFEMLTSSTSGIGNGLRNENMYDDASATVATGQCSGMIAGGSPRPVARYCQSPRFGLVSVICVCSSSPIELGEGLLHGAVLETVEGNDSNPSPGVEPASTASRFAASANQVEEGLQSCDFLVQGDSKCHECAGRRVEARRAGPGAIGFPYQSGQLSRGRNRPCLTLKYNFSGNGGCIGVLAVGPYEFCKFPFLDSGEQGHDALAAILVQSHVQRSVFLEAKPSLGIIQLIGGHPEIGEDDIHLSIHRPEVSGGRDE